MQFKIVRSKRRSIAIEINCEGEITVRAPFKTADSVLQELVFQKRDWIEKTIKKQVAKKSDRPELSADEIRLLKEKAKQILPGKVEYYGKRMSLLPTSLKITSAKTRFGSCSAKNGICFSYRLMMYPEEAIDYVVVHELAHIKYHDHSKRFWGLVERYMPDYKSRRELLK